MLPSSILHSTTVLPLLAALMCGSLLSAGALKPGDVSGVIRSIDADGIAQLELSTGEQARAKLSKGDSLYLKAGDRVRAKVIEQPGGYLLQTVWPDDPQVKAQMVAVNSRLRRDTEVRGRQVFRSIGEKLPPFALYNQHGDLVKSSDLRGKICVVNFIFTRCMNPRMCPAATMRMKQLQEKAKEEGLRDILFISMTLDPDFDTPGVFNAYAADRDIDGSSYYFLGGPKEVLFDLKEQLGILATKDPKLIIDHTMRTIIVDPSGEIVYQVPGSMWGMDDFLKRIESLNTN